MTLIGLEKIQVSVTDMCNRKCNICPHVDENVFPNKKVWMTIETAENLAKNLEENHYNGLVSISGYGEPLLHKQLPEIIEQFTKRKIKTRLFTNADLIVKEKVRTDILDNLGLDELVVSTYDGQQQFLMYRKFVNTKFTKTPVRVKDLYIKDSEIPKTVGWLTNRTGTLYKDTRLTKSVCHRPYYNIQIDWDGDVLICCEDWIRKTRYDNINETPFSEIWLNNTLLNEHRKLLSEKRRDQILACSNCNNIERRSIPKEWNN